MKSTLLYITAIAACFSCKRTSNITTPIATVYDSSYKPAYFSDPGRLEKIKSACPVIDSMYKKHAEDNHFPAISFGIVVGGELVYENSYGYTDLERKTPATSASLFRIASMSKSFTCMAILKLR